MSLNLPAGIASIIQLFSKLFSTRVWKQAEVLMIGAILTTRKLQNDFQWQVQQTSWYSKHLPSFSDALALVRRFFWASTFSMSYESFEMVKVPRPLFERLRDIAVYAA